MQRQANKANNKHLNYINRVLRYCKRAKTGMYFKNLVAPVRAVVIADAAYKRMKTRQIASR
eukprot:9842849-Prorocentrum_lima.AAC.1